MLAMALAVGEHPGRAGRSRSPAMWSLWRFEENHARDPAATGTRAPSADLGGTPCTGSVTGGVARQRLVRRGVGGDDDEVGIAELESSVVEPPGSVGAKLRGAAIFDVTAAHTGLALDEYRAAQTEAGVQLDTRQQLWGTTAPVPRMRMALASP